MSGARWAWALALLLAAVPAARAEGVAIRGRVHTGDGRVLEDGGVLVARGRVVRVAPWAELEAPAGARVVALPGAEVTPGLIDAASQAGVAEEAEHEAEVVPHLRVLDALDLRDEVWARLLAQGVTTVWVTPPPGAVIGGRGALLKTAGPRVVDAAGAVKLTLGREGWVRGARNHGPWGSADVTTRYPTTRMGMVWVVRDALAAARAGALEGPAGEALAGVLAGEVGLRVQARQLNDLETALRLLDEAGVARFVLEEATEAHRLLEPLAARRVPVVFGPLFERPRGWRARTGEAEDPCLRTPVLLAEAGVPFCLTASDRAEAAGLQVQLMLAVRYGLAPEAALEAVTAAPARILGVAERLGTLEAGKDADLVVWSGPPHEATSKPLLVLVEGAVALGDLPAATAAAPETPEVEAPSPGDAPAEGGE